MSPSRGAMRIFQGAALAAIFAFISPVRAREMQRHELEFRYGLAETCGTCVSQNLWSPMAKGDVLFQGVLDLSDSWRLGGYGKLGGYAGIWQGAAGVLAGYDFGPLEVRAFTGFAYAGGETPAVRSGLFLYPGQTRQTYDLGLSLRVPISDRLRLTLTYGHNSNGEAIGLNFFGPRDHNPGIDGIQLGVSCLLDGSFIPGR